MLSFNGKKFARNNDEFTDSLFDCGSTCVGYYKRTKNGVVLYDMQRNKIGMVTKHKVLASASRLQNGKWWYSYATIPQIGEYSYSQMMEDINNALAHTEEAV